MNMFAENQNLSVIINNLQSPSILLVVFTELYSFMVLTSWWLLEERS